MLRTTGAKHLVVQIALGEIDRCESTGPRILIVDDMQLMRKKVRDILETNGYQVVGEADDGDIAVEMAGRLQPDLIIMDINMSRMCGIEATAEIKRKNPDAKIVVLTSEVKPSVVVASLRAGASNYMPKSFEAGEVLRVVKHALSL